jgi:predicted amidohydrolase YtcJ
LLAVDCSASNSIGELQQVLRDAALTAQGAGWLRAWDYDETRLRERRHPTRWDLDAAVPDRPVRLAHRSGHAHVLNSKALAAVGVPDDGGDPPGVAVERDERGVPTGLLLEAEAFLDARVSRLTRSELRDGVRNAARLLLSRGVTGIQDATPANDLSRWALFRQMVADGDLPIPCVFMPGLAHLPDFLNAGLGFGAGDGGVRVGPAKGVITLSTGELRPSRPELTEMVGQAHQSGFPVALHAVEAEAVRVAAEVLGGVQRRTPRPGLRHRIEHASECPPDVLEAVREAGVIVITNPGFLHANGDRYLREVSQAMQPWLYRIGSLHRAGVPVAFGSDAPVGIPDSLLAAQAAVTRKSASGAMLGPNEIVSMDDALRMSTVDAVHASGLSLETGIIAPNMRADFVLLDKDPTKVPPEELGRIRVLKTIVGGVVAFEG